MNTLKNKPSGPGVNNFYKINRPNGSPEATGRYLAERYKHCHLSASGIKFCCKCIIQVFQYNVTFF